MRRMRTRRSIGHNQSAHAQSGHAVAVAAARRTVLAAAASIVPLASEGDETGHDDDHGHDDEQGHSEHILPWYQPPVQRILWGESYTLPHVNWGDLFFDLFYVAAAYNLGSLISSAAFSVGLFHTSIYFVGTFGPLWITWEADMMYQSRYATVDYVHRLFGVARYLCVGLAILHLRPGLSDPTGVNDQGFTLAVLCEKLLQLASHVELYFKGVGDEKAIKHHTLTQIKFNHLPTLLIYIAAFVSAAIFHVQAREVQGNDSPHAVSRLILEKDAAANDDIHDQHGPGGEAEYHELEQSWKLSDLPLALTAFAYLQNIVVVFLVKLEFRGRSEDVRHWFVPNNVDYMIHRYGEWILLMIGEGILSLLINETGYSRKCYITVISGILTIIFLQILKFESEPHRAEEHALYKNLRSGTCYSVSLQVLSMCLIVFGKMYKFLLAAVAEDAANEGASGGHGNYGKGSGLTSRLLAGGDYISKDDAAIDFTISLSVILVTLELMRCTHFGIKGIVRRLFHNAGNDERSTPNWPIIGVTIINLGLVLLAMALTELTMDPVALALSSCGIVLGLLLTRVMNFFLLNRELLRQVMPISLR